MIIDTPPMIWSMPSVVLIVSGLRSPRFYCVERCSSMVKKFGYGSSSMQNRSAEISMPQSFSSFIRATSSSDHAVIEEGLILFIRYLTTYDVTIIFWVVSTGHTRAIPYLFQPHSFRCKHLFVVRFGPLRKRVEHAVDLADFLLELDHNTGDLTASNEWTW